MIEKKYLTELKIECIKSQNYAVRIYENLKIFNENSKLV